MAIVGVRVLPKNPSQEDLEDLDITLSDTAKRQGNYSDKRQRLFRRAFTEAMISRLWRQMK